MLKILLTSIVLMLTSYGAYAACTRQLITLPDGRTMVCFYCNEGRIVDCSPL